SVPHQQRQVDPAGSRTERQRARIHRCLHDPAGERITRTIRPELTFAAAFFLPRARLPEFKRAVPSFFLASFPSESAIFSRMQKPALALLLYLAISSIGRGQTPRISDAENSFADLSNASAAYRTIQSGLFKTYQGRDSTAWLGLYTQKRS